MAWIVQRDWRRSARGAVVRAEQLVVLPREVPERIGGDDEVGSFDAGRALGFQRLSDLLASRHVPFDLGGGKPLRERLPQGVLGIVAYAAVDPKRVMSRATAKGCELGERQKRYQR